MSPTCRQEVDAILAGARAERAALLEGLSPALRASLPVDATGLTEAIDHLGRAAGVGDDLRRRQARAHRANPAVLHGRVYGRAPLPAETVRAAFVEGARVRAELLGQLAQTIGGAALAEEIGTLLDAHPPRADALRQAYAAQERAVLRIAEHLDAAGAS